MSRNHRQHNCPARHIPQPTKTTSTRSPTDSSPSTESVRRGARPHIEFYRPVPNTLDRACRPVEEYERFIHTQMYRDVVIHYPATRCGMKFQRQSGTIERPPADLHQAEQAVVSPHPRRKPDLIVKSFNCSALHSQVSRHPFDYTRPDFLQHPLNSMPARHR